MQDRLRKLEKADILREGRNSFYYRGLGDPVFEIIFRRIYEEDIERVDTETLDARLQKKLRSLEGKVSYFKGMAAEYRVINRLTTLAQRETPLAEITTRTAPDSPRLFGPFRKLGKRTPLS